MSQRSAYPSACASLSPHFSQLEAMALVAGHTGLFAYVVLILSLTTQYREIFKNIGTHRKAVGEGHKGVRDVVRCGPDGQGGRGRSRRVTCRVTLGLAAIYTHIRRSCSNPFALRSKPFLKTQMVVKKC